MADPSNNDDQMMKDPEGVVDVIRRALEERRAG
jgi:hypothetical protein